MHPKLIDALQQGVFPITTRVSIGRFAAPDRCAYLHEQGITHILNVSDAESLSQVRDFGFSRVEDIAISDNTRMPTDQALLAVQTLHSMLNVDDSQVYLHCIAGQNRCPTVLWLYLIAMGMGKASAKQMITSRCPDAQPGHNTLVDAALVAEVNEWGRKLGYIDRASLTEPAYE
ncbi:dual specificity protein phosphatase family protein [Blastopirellula marina]|uniref:Tyrosine specific protein phosphatases domain-containing protein n=1 Tax=Blastopirellula marina TaxID=124 RepID=A0A2S8GMP7_9BACT|nr:dual specificity protein phosphatase family protein [Blastopirellula marina]PQO45294.1 hypothetical protein C5Y93_15175 [Blastopirellula marina]